MSGNGIARILTWCVTAGAAVGGLLWFLGVSWPFAVAAAVLAVAVGGSWAGFTGAERPQYFRPVDDPRPGTRSEVSQTAWALRGRRGEVTDLGRKRLRAFARSRLRRRGLDLDDPADADAIAALITPRAAALLGRGVRMRIADVEYCLDRLEALARTDLRPPTRTDLEPASPKGSP
ncbi:hypothetical protein [Microbacterium sp.]|uniref:hypothetical protein n=1 Tax=Microbacterium sp. TaxID=51671 RepID=UPI003A8E1ED1